MLNSQGCVSQKVVLRSPWERKNFAQSFFFFLLLFFSKRHHKMFPYSVILTVPTGQVIMLVARFRILHLHWKWIRKQLQTRMQHGSFSQRSIPKSPPDGSLSRILWPQGRIHRPRNCCTAQREAETLDLPRCCSHRENAFTFFFSTKACECVFKEDEKAET